MTYQDAYYERWHTALILISEGYARGLWADRTTPEALLQLYGAHLLKTLLLWYGEENFREA